MVTIASSMKCNLWGRKPVRKIVNNWKVVILLNNNLL